MLQFQPNPAADGGARTGRVTVLRNVSQEQQRQKHQQQFEFDTPNLLLPTSGAALPVSCDLLEPLGVCGVVVAALDLYAPLQRNVSCTSFRTLLYMWPVTYLDAKLLLLFCTWCSLAASRSPLGDKQPRKEAPPATSAWQTQSSSR